MTPVFFNGLIKLFWKNNLLQWGRGVVVEFAGDACSLRTGCCSRCSSWHQGCSGCPLGGPACSSTALGPAGSASSCSAASARPHRPHVTDLQPSACICKTTETPTFTTISLHLQDHRDPPHLQPSACRSQTTDTSVVTVTPSQPWWLYQTMKINNDQLALERGIHLYSSAGLRVDTSHTFVAITLPSFALTNLFCRFSFHSPFARHIQCNCTEGREKKMLPKAALK